MKLYTLEYDCNRPTVQQVNIPTNTDYKIGVKVRRNGKVQKLDPNEVAIRDLSADSNKTNDYVTFTLSSGDEASYDSHTVNIEHGYDFNDYVKVTGLMDSTDFYNFPDTYTAEYLGIGGYELAVDNISWGFKKQAGTPVDVEDITSWFTVPTYPTVNYPFKWPNGTVAVATDRFFGFSLFDAAGNLIANKLDKIVIDPSWHLNLAQHGIKGTGGNYYVLAYKFILGTPFTANFKLNVNTFKSQQGDIAETVVDMPAVKVDGTYADGTEFSYSFVMK